MGAKFLILPVLLTELLLELVRTLLESRLETGAGRLASNKTKKALSLFPKLFSAPGLRALYKARKAK